MEPIVLHRRGLLGRPSSRIVLDPAAGRLVLGGRTLDLAEIRHLELQKDFLTVGTSRDWDTIDLRRYRDGQGPLADGKGRKEGATKLVEALKEAIAGNRARPSPGGPPQAPGSLGYFPFEFRFLVRIDRGAIVLTAASIAIIILDLYMVTREWLLSWSGLGWFLALVGLGGLGLFLRRRSSGLRFDDEGVTVRRPGRVTFYPWRDVREFRRQHGEVELCGQGFRVPTSLDVLAAGRTPLILRRGREASQSLPAILFLYWLRSRLPEKPEPPIEASPRDRTIGRWWIGSLVAANAALFIAEGPFGGDAFRDRLVHLGARTADWMREPWRLLTSLFLHGSPSHLFFNMFMLAVLAPWVGRVFGWTRSLVIYLAGGILGNVLGELLSRRHGPDVPAVGASTAILALLGALLGATYRHPESVPLAARARFRWAIPVTLLLTLGLGIVIPVLDNGAHLGGFIAGFALAWAFTPER